MTQQPDFWESKQGDGSAEKLPTKTKKKKEPNPWNEGSNMNPTKASETTGP